MTPQEKLIVALDILEEKKALEMIDILSPGVGIFKVGIAPFTGFGGSLLRRLEEKNKKVFLDLKFFDIPNTVHNAAFVSGMKKVYMINFHCMGGRKMLEKAVSGALNSVDEKGGVKPILLGVTVLTSMDDEDLREIGIKGEVEEQVLRFAQMAKDAGLDGVVASAKETKKIKEKCGKGFLVVTPGIRPSWTNRGDQKRVMSPDEAIKNGSDYIVVGRPVIEAEDPLKAVMAILEEMT